MRGGRHPLLMIKLAARVGGLMAITAALLPASGAALNSHG
jgi:hypothetical protein